MQLKRVLIVDDALTTRAALKRQLELQSFPYEVITAGNGTMALTYLRQQKYDVLVVDHQLPDYNGLQVARLARAMWPGIRTMLITGDISLDLEWAKKQGELDACLRKPFKAVEFLAIVEQLCH